MNINDYINEYFSNNMVLWCPSKSQNKDINLEFNKKVNLENISYDQEINEDFIKKFKDEVDWDDLSINQKLSEDFILKFYKKLHPMNILKKRKIIFSKFFLVRYLKYYKKWYIMKFNYYNDKLKYIPIRRYLIFKLPNLPNDICKIINLYY